MNQRNLILACLAAGEGHLYEPVQIQKLVFLFQERAASLFETRPFSFRPYDYGPFAPAVYEVLERLGREGLVEIIGQPFNRRRFYQLSAEGKKPADEALASLPGPFRSYLMTLSQWVRCQSFAQLVGAVYREFPEMKANSIFQS